MGGSIGPHRVEIEGALVHILACGDVTLPQMKALIPIYESVLAEHDRVLILMNLAHVGDVGFDTRKLAMEWSRRHASSTITGVYGASFFMRNIVNLVHRAQRAIVGSTAQLRFFEGEAEARAWLRSVERSFSQRPSGTPPNPG